MPFGANYCRFLQVTAASPGECRRSVDAAFANRVANVNANSVIPLRRISQQEMFFWEGEFFLHPILFQFQSTKDNMRA